MSCSVAFFQGCSPHPMALCGTKCSRRAKPSLWGLAVRGLWCLCFAGDQQHLPVLPRAQHCLGFIMAPNRTGWARINTHLAGAVH